MAHRLLRIVPVLFALLFAAPVPQGFTETVVTRNLSRPVGLAFAPDGRLFIIEQYTGKIRILKDGTLLPTPFATVSPLYTRSNETGLLGICLHPQFATNGYVYVFATQSNSVQRVLRYTAIGDTGNNPTVIVDNLPSIGTFHNGGGIGFGPDGKLYVMVGDNWNFDEESQDPRSVRGKLLRYNADGTVPTDNPFGRGNPVFCIGLRNTFRFCFQPGTGKIFATENSYDHNDEINILKPGKNYGWPTVVGTSTSATYENPIQVFSTSIAPTGIAFFNGSLLYSNYKFNKIVRLTLDGERVVSSSDFATGIPEPIDIAVSPQGELYYCSLRGTLYRTTAPRQNAANTNAAPSASFTVTPAEGPLPLNVSLDASTSSDPDGSVVTYAWNFGDGSTATGVRTTHTFTHAGTFTVLLQVTDDDGAIATTSTPVSVLQGTNRAPSSHIESALPLEGPAPLRVRFAGHGHDDGTVTRHTWDFGDRTRRRIFQNPGSDTNTRPVHVYRRPGTYTVTLTVQDDRGLRGTHTQTIIVTPSH